MADLLIERGLLGAPRADAFVTWLAASTARPEDLAATLSDVSGLGPSQLADALGLDASDLPTVAPGALMESALRAQEAALRHALREWLTPGTQGLAQDLLGVTPPTAPPGPVDEAATPTVRLDGTPPATSPAGASRALVQRRYEVLRRVSKGGMGAILLCWDRELRREVAMKVMLAGVRGEEGTLRFLREARTAAQLQHPGILPVFDSGRLDVDIPGEAVGRGDPFFVMRWLPEAKELGEVLREDKQSLFDLMEIFERICRAVEYAHQRGVIHRDLKPANVLLSQHGEVFVADFGLAKAVEEAQTEAKGRDDDASEGMTLSGTVMGTPWYMAPEQAAGEVERVDAQSDVYSLGAILYQVLTLRTPYHEAKQPSDALVAILRNPPQRPSMVRKGVNREMEATCMRAMARAKADRYSSARELADEVHRWRGDLQQQVEVGYALAYEKYLEKRRPTAQWLVAARAMEHAADARLASAQAWGDRIEEGSFSNPHVVGHLVSSVGYSTVRFSADGLLLLARSTDGHVHFWDVSHGREVRRIDANEHPATAIAFSPEGSMMALGSEDNKIKLWDLATGRLRATLEGHGDRVATVAFSPDGATLASGGEDKTIHLWDTSTGRLRVRLEGHGREVTAVAFSPDGGTLASGSWDIKLWDVATGRLRVSLEGHEYYVRGLAFRPDATTLASGGADGAIRLWDVATGRLRAMLEGHKHEVTSVGFSPDGETLASASLDKTVGLWDVATGRSRATLEGSGFATTSVAFSPDGTMLVSNSKDRTIGLWWLVMGRLRATLEGHCKYAMSVAFSPDGATLASGSGDKTIKLWDVASGRLRATLGTHEAQVTSVAFSPDGRMLASGSMDHAINLWDVTSGRVRVTLEGHEKTVESVAFSPDGATLASGSGDRTIRLWDVATGRLGATLEGHGDWVLCVAFSPDRRTLASGGEDRTIRLWDVATACLRATLEGNERAVTGVAFSPDGATLASAGADGTLRVWDGATGDLRSTLHTGVFACTSVAFSPDGATLASAGEDKTIKLWDVAAGRLRATLEGHRKHVMSVAFSPDGETVASGSYDTTVRLWDVGRAPHFSSVEVERLTGARLIAGLEVAPLPDWRPTVPRLDFVAAPGFALAPSPEPPSETNDYLTLHWPDDSPYHWMPGADAGNAEALYRLAVIRERQKRDKDALALLEKCAALTDPASRDWASKSQRRLASMPWLLDAAKPPK